MEYINIKISIFYTKSGYYTFFSNSFATVFGSFEIKQKENIFFNFFLFTEKFHH